MICATTKKGVECFFMTRKGCSFNGGTCHEIVAQCQGCGHVIAVADKNYCQAFPDPASKWVFGSCNLATHVVRKFAAAEKKVNPLKASKKAAQGKM